MAPRNLGDLMKTRTLLLCLTALAISSPARSHAQGTGATSTEPVDIPIPVPATMTVEDITICMRMNAVDRGSLRAIDVHAVGREGEQRNLKMKLFWKPGEGRIGQRMTLQVVEPEQYAGSAYLVRTRADGEEEIYIYASALDKAQRVIGLESDRPLFGTDITFAEVGQLQGLVEGDGTKRIDDAEVFGRQAFVLETTRDPKQTIYTKVRAYIDQTTCTLLKSEIFGKGDTPRKVLEADISTLIDVDRWWLVLGYEMKDLQRQTRTRIDLSHVSLLESVPESLFSPEEFYKPEMDPSF